MFSLIASVDKNFAIGYKNDLLYRIPHDMRRFKNLTMGKKVLIGRKTYQSLENGLPGRNIIVVTHDKNFYLSKSIYHSVKYDSSVQVCSDLELFLCENEFSKEEIFIIGGGEIYRQAFSYANKIYLTRIHKKFDNADVFFPNFFDDTWKKLSGRTLFHDDISFHYDFFWR